MFHLLNLHSVLTKGTSLPEVGLTLPLLICMSPVWQLITAMITLTKH